MKHVRIETSIIIVFFQFDERNPREKIISFNGNSAIQGGDMIFGGCLSNCSVWIDETLKTINKSDPSNIIWRFVTLENVLSQSTFIEHPKRAAFCRNTSSSCLKNVTCSYSHVVEVYSGEVFNVSLMVVDDFCSPSIELIQATL